MPADTLPYLTYLLLPGPDPLRASGADVPSIASLTVIVSNSGTERVECSSITVSLLVGTAAKDFASDATGIGTVRPDGWNASVSGGSIIFQPASPVLIGKDSLTFVVTDITVNEQPGATAVSVIEVASVAGQPAQTGRIAISLAKFPAGFTLSGPVADPLVVASGGGSTISWTGSAASYTLTYDAGTGAPVVVPGLPASWSYTASGLIGPQPVIFTLGVKVPVPGADQPVSLQRQVGVTIEPVAPTITRFTASLSHEQVSFRWATQNAVSCQIDGFPTLLVPNGTAPFTAPLGTEYTLSAMAQSGLSATSSTWALTWGVLQPTGWVAGPATAVAVTQDGRYLYIGNLNDNGLGGPPGGTITMYDTRTWATVVETTSYGASTLLLSPDGSMLCAAVSSVDNEGYGVVFLDAKLLTYIGETQAQTNADLMATDVTGATLFGVGLGAPSFWAFATANGQLQVSSSAVSGIATGIATSPVEDVVFAAQQQPNQVHAIDITTGGVVRSTTLADVPGPLVASPDGAQLYVTQVNAQAVLVLDSTTFAILQTIPCGGAPLAITLSIDGKRLFIVAGMTQGTAVTVIDTKTFAARQTMPVQNAMPASVVSAPAVGRLYIVGGPADSSGNPSGLVSVVAITGATTETS